MWGRLGHAVRAPTRESTAAGCTHEQSSIVDERALPGHGHMARSHARDVVRAEAETRHLTETLSEGARVLCAVCGTSLYHSCTRSFSSTYIIVVTPSGRTPAPRTPHAADTHNPVPETRKSLSGESDWFPFCTPYGCIYVVVPQPVCVGTRARRAGARAHTLLVERKA